MMRHAAALLLLAALTVVPVAPAAARRCAHAMSPACGAACAMHRGAAPAPRSTAAVVRQDAPRPAAIPVPVIAAVTTHYDVIAFGALRCDDDIGLFAALRI